MEKIPAPKICLALFDERRKHRGYVRRYAVIVETYIVIDGELWARRTMLDGHYMEYRKKDKEIKIGGDDHYIVKMVGGYSNHMLFACATQKKVIAQLIIAHIRKKSPEGIFIRKIPGEDMKRMTGGLYERMKLNMVVCVPLAKVSRGGNATESEFERGGRYAI